MPNCFCIGNYYVYFWLDEGIPLEPCHVHVSEGRPSKNGTKIWITSDGKCILCHNKSKIPEKKLFDFMLIIAANSDDIIQQWKDRFGSISFVQ